MANSLGVGRRTPRVATRQYGAGLSRLAVGSASARTASGITAEEVLVHPSVRCFIRVGGSTVTATTNDIPLEAGEKFHLGLSSGQYIAVIRDTEDGFLNLVPVT